MNRRSLAPSLALALILGAATAGAVQAGGPTRRIRLVHGEVLRRLHLRDLRHRDLHDLDRALDVQGIPRRLSDLPQRSDVRARRSPDPDREGCRDQLHRARWLAHRGRQAHPPHRAQGRRSDPRRRPDRVGRVRQCPQCQRAASRLRRGPGLRITAPEPIPFPVRVIGLGPGTSAASRVYSGDD